MPNFDTYYGFSTLKCSTSSKWAQDVFGSPYSVFEARIWQDFFTCSSIPSLCIAFLCIFSPNSYMTSTALETLQKYNFIVSKNISRVLTWKFCIFHPILDLWC